MVPAIEVAQVSKRYGALCALDAVSLEIAQGEFFGLLGPNSSSSLMQSKMTGNIVFVLLPPLSHREFFAAYLLAAIARGLTVGCAMFVITLWFVEVPMAHPLWAIAFALAGSAVLGALGVIAGMHSDKVDELSAFTNFIILPLTFLSGVFYSIHSLSPFWQALSHLNSIFYMIDGFRYGFFGHGDVPPHLSLAIVVACFLALSWFTLWLLETGYKLRH
jgi:ABC-2 type transport system permease protein